MLRRYSAILAGFLVLTALPVTAFAATPQWLDASPSVAGSPGTTELDFDLAVTPDGTEVLAFDANHGSALGIWVVTRPPGGDWLSAEPLTPTDQYSAQPAVSVDSRGNVYVAWYAQDSSGNYRIQWAKRSSGGTWTTPAWVSPAGADAFSPRIAAQHGVVAFVWQTSDGTTQRAEGRVRRSDGTWSKAQYLSRADPWLAAEMTVAIDRTGKVFAAWKEYQGMSKQEIHLRTMPFAGSWSANERISPLGKTADGPVLVADPKGGLFATWTEFGAVNGQILAWHRSSSGSTTRKLVTPDTEDAARPVLAVSSRGDEAIGFVKADSQVQAVYRPAGGSWSSVEDVSFPSPDGLWLTDIAFLAGGDVTMLWTALSSTTYTMGSADRTASSGTWNAPHVVAGPGTNYPNGLLGSDDEGNAYVVWSEPSGADMALYSRLGDAHGPTTTIQTITPPRTTGTSAFLSWSGMDRISPVSHYDVAWRQAPWNGATGTWSTFLGATTNTSYSISINEGTTSCFRARGIDDQSWVGSWSKPVCTTTPVDDRTAANHGFSNGSDASFYDSTFRESSTAGSRLVYSHAVGRALYLLAEKAPGDGTVEVLWNGTLIKTVKLTATSLKTQQVILLASWKKARTGDLTIRVKGSGRPVRIDGIFVQK